MIKYNKSKICLLGVLIAMGGCTKLDQNLNSTLTSSQTSTALGANGTQLLLQTAYADIATPFTAQDNVFSLEENSTDESLVPTRGGDWDDNGVWRVIHSHSWNADHGQLLTVFNNLNKLNFDATNVLAFNPSTEQAAEARFLRAFALYQLLDLYGQYPFRNPGDNLLNPPVVKSGADAINFIISELTAILPNLAATNPNTIANPDAARTLLMKCYLNKGAFVTRTAPTFDAGDMAQVITLGNTIINSNKYSYTPKYFDNFSVDNGTKSKEGIFAYPNATGVSVNNSAPQARWMMTLHYNSYTPANPNSGWNGFSTTANFYNSFGVSGATTNTPKDTLLDPRLGGRYYQGATNVSGIRPGFLVGQQYNEAGVAIQDRKGNPLAYTPTISSTMIETGNNLEVTGIRVVKYVPDYTTGATNYATSAGNWIMLYRYSDVVLMVAEAKMRTGDNAGGLALVNALRTARGTSTMPSISLVNTANVNDPNTLLSERGRELYWETQRRMDLIRFGVFTKAWDLKAADAGTTYLVYPVPNQALAANPNLVQNPGY